MALVLLAASGVASAQYDVGIAAPNWSVPPYRTSGASGGLSTMADISPGVAFVAVSPCRVFDTRGAVGPYGGPRLVANTTRNFDIDSGPCTGIPAGVDAYSMNFGAILPDGANSFITIWPTGTAQPTVSAINPVQGVVVANAAIVPAGTNGSISVFPNTGVHLYGDINGYFTDQYNPGVSFHAVSSTIAPAILGENTSLVNDAVAIQGVITSTNPGANAAAVRGNNNSTTDKGVGVLGVHNGSAFGVWGISVSGSGVFGEARATTGTGKGVSGVSSSLDPNTAGVFGVARGLVTDADVSAAGVRGESAEDIGVLGLTQNGNFGYAVLGRIQGSSAGVLGYEGGPIDYGVYSSGDAHVQGTFTATTNKGFVQPHPHDASKEIRYISLEGPHTEVYFRGTAQVSQGVTRIPIPQHFRFVADAATYSTLVTPVGAMATVAVISEGPDGIVVQASRNVKIHYVVYAEREAVRNPDPIIENVHSRSDPERDVLAHLPDTFRELMIQNGTLNSDGTVNMETARRLGWDREWEKRSPSLQPVE
jgi:hypothetical protein